MMRKLFLIISFILISLVSSSAQTVNGKEIRNRDVVWSDFTGEVDKNSKWDAWTYWVTTYSFPSPTIVGNNVRVRVTVRLFLRSDSWVRPNKKSARLLKHEQGHYRIGRICANDIERTINSMEFSRNNYHKEVDAVYWKIIEKYQAMNRLYDLETNHYNNLKQQALWDKKLQDLLNQ